MSFYIRGNHTSPKVDVLADMALSIWSIFFATALYVSLTRLTIIYVGVNKEYHIPYC